ncbi:CD225/dispanin family protein [Gordonia shandongensis]|uniref:CD225/dispanin family protein n=1 Tax=Gordonia shandongensis TaxID=376351 RepID=UPI0003FD7B28|nr:CD225/dispanin family protein [Gordonia shandongensis]
MTNPNDPPENVPGGGQPGGEPFGGVPPYGSPQYGAQGGAPQPGYQAGMQAEPASNLVWAILSTIFCCLPLGIVSIVKASSVGKLWAQGDVAGAHKAAEDAKKFAIWAAVVGIVFSILYLILMAAGVFALDLDSTTSTY